MIAFSTIRLLDLAFNQSGGTSKTVIVVYKKPLMKDGVLAASVDFLCFNIGGLLLEGMHLAICRPR